MNAAGRADYRALGIAFWFLLASAPPHFDNACAMEAVKVGNDRNVCVNSNAGEAAGGK